MKYSRRNFVKQAAVGGIGAAMPGEGGLPDPVHAPAFPDFTRGKWITNKPVSGLTDEY
jgi:hypothetical protein